MRFIHHRIKVQEAVAAFIAVGLVAPILWMVLDRAPPYIVDSGKLVPDKVEAGKEIEIVWKVTVTRYCPSASSANVSRFFIDRDHVEHSVVPTAATFSSRKTGEVIIRNRITVPSIMPDGKAWYYSRPCYPCNPIQEVFWPICFTTPKLPFEVVSGGDTGDADVVGHPNKLKGDVK